MFIKCKGGDFTELVTDICSIIITAVGALYFYQLLYVVLGLFFTKRFKESKCYHRYAIVISARNEEKVIGNLLESIARQDYPKEYLSVFVVADNCNDRTAEIARKMGAYCYERFDSEHCTKGYALQFLFEKIEKDFGRDSFEAYMIFDADNLLASDYVSRMNDAFDSGEKIVTSYRNTKNLDSNFIAAGYGFHWLRTARFTSRGRSFLGVTTWIQGCGFMFAAELVKDGWNYTSLTEDRAFSIDAVIKGYTVSYQNEAVFYDEQPTKMKIVMRQRIRWAKGHLQAFAENWLVLIKGIFTGKSLRGKWNCYDMLITMMPYNVLFIPLKILKYIATVVILFTTVSFGLRWLAAIPQFFEILVFERFGVIPQALLLFVLEYKRIAKIKWYKAIFYSLMFPMFEIVGDIATWIAMFSKVTWKPIPHEESITISEIEQRVEEKVR